MDRILHFPFNTLVDTFDYDTQGFQFYKGFIMVTVIHPCLF